MMEALAPEAVVSQVARRHGLRPGQLFGWLREARKAGGAGALLLAERARYAAELEARDEAKVSNHELITAEPDHQRSAAHNV